MAVFFGFKRHPARYPSACALEELVTFRKIGPTTNTYVHKKMIIQQIFIYLNNSKEHILIRVPFSCVVK